MNDELQREHFECTKTLSAMVAKHQTVIEGHQQMLDGVLGILRAFAAVLGGDGAGTERPAALETASAQIAELERMMQLPASEAEGGPTL